MVTGSCWKWRDNPKGIQTGAGTLYDIEKLMTQHCAKNSEASGG